MLVTVGGRRTAFRIQDTEIQCVICRRWLPDLCRSTFNTLYIVCGDRIFVDSAVMLRAYNYPKRKKNKNQIINPLFV